MARTIYYVAASLDGYIADADGRLDWLFAFNDAVGVKEHYERFIASVGAIAMGRATLDFVVDEGHPWAYRVPTWVFTRRTLPLVPDADLRVANDVRAAHREMVELADDKDIWLVGGGQVAAQWLALGLIDELWLGVVPVFLGDGVPLIAAKTERLELLATTQFGMGLVELRYRFPGATALTLEEAPPG